MPKKLDSCVKQLIAKGHSEDSAWAICKSNFKDSFNFSDKIQYKDRKCISVRDGVQEYYGFELGIEPHDEVIKIYRSPDTIQKANDSLIGIPITLEHVDVDGEPPRDGGVVQSSNVIEYPFEDTDTTIAVENELKLSDSIEQSGSNEFSLGYKAKLVPHEKYDFEQVDIVPHHLALVERGRCGSACSFSDSNSKQGKNMKLKELLLSFKDGKKDFLDADGESMNMQSIIETVSALPEAIKQVPMEKLNELMPAIQELVQVSKEAGLEIGEEEPQEMEDEEPSKEEEKKEEVAMQDSEAFKDAIASATKAAVLKHGEVMEKAKDFLDDSYSFKDKTTCQIMADAVATQHGGEQFKDNELNIAFKMLKKDTSLENFGDSQGDKWDTLKDKEL